MGYVRIRFNLLSLSFLGSHFLAILCVQGNSYMIYSRSFYLNFILLSNNKIESKGKVKFSFSLCFLFLSWQFS